MPLLALVVTDAHNAETLFAALPGGAIYTTVKLSNAEWQKSPERLASEYGVPVIARSQQEWNKQPRP